jgi:hypothetical protein
MFMGIRLILASLEILKATITRYAYGSGKGVGGKRPLY